MTIVFETLVFIAVALIGCTFNIELYKKMRNVITKLNYYQSLIVVISFMLFLAVSPFIAIVLIEAILMILGI